MMQEKFRKTDFPNFFKTDTEDDMTRGDSNLFQYFTTHAERRHGPCSKLYARPIGSEDEIRRAKANFTFENFEGQDEVSLEAPEFQRKEVDLTKPFHIWHVTDTFHWSWLKALDTPQLVTISSQFQGVVLYCIFPFDES